MSKKIDIKKGDKYGRLTIIKEIIPSIFTRGDRGVLCKCECGKERSVTLNHLRTGHTTSCGCFRTETTSKKNFKHGQSNIDGKQSKLYMVWSSMKDRCKNLKNKSFKYYGKRGIKVCKEWMNFENFYKDMGDRPVGTSIDRIDNNKGYSKQNCRWATRKEQSNNTSVVKKIKYKGETLSQSDWSRKLGGNPTLVGYRLKKGYTQEEAVSLPLIKGKNYEKRN